MKSTIYFRIAACFLISCLMSTLINTSITPIVSGTCCDQNTIVVSGQSTVFVQPDIAVISLGISSTQKTSQEAVTQVNSKIAQIMQILNQNSINQTDILTLSLVVYPEYSYLNGVSQVIGQNAQQTLSVKIRNINSTGGNLGPLIDSLINVNGIQLNSLSFDKEDKTVAQTQARKQAFNDAKNKASDYAGFASRIVGRVITIVDGVISQAMPVALSDSNFKVAASMVSAPTVIQVGTIQVSYSTLVTFALR